MKSTKSTKKRLVIVNQTRFIIATVLTLIIFSAIITYVSGSFISEATSTKDIISVTISPGDTLWDLASEYNYFNEDIREVVYRIKKYNELNNEILLVGQVVEIPIKK